MMNAEYKAGTFFILFAAIAGCASAGTAPNDRDGEHHERPVVLFGNSQNMGVEWRELA